MLGIKVCGVDSYVRDGHAWRLAAAAGWVSFWMYKDGRGAGWFCCRSDQIDSAFVRMEEEVY